MKPSRTLFSYLILFFFFFYLLCRPSLTIQSAKSGIIIWYKIILPSFLPIMILSQLLLESKLLLTLCHPFFYAIFIGIFCGFPMGAKTTCELYDKGYLSKEEASYLLCVTNNASPAFITSFLAYSLLHHSSYGIYFFLCIHSVNFLLALIFFLLHPVKFTPFKRDFSLHTPSIIESLTLSLESALRSIVMLGGYIVLFSVLQGAFYSFLPKDNFLCSLLCASLEISNGTVLLASLEIPFSLKCASLLSLSSFGGLCILAQTYNYTKSCGIKIQPYLRFKLVNMAVLFSLVSIYLI